MLQVNITWIVYIVMSLYIIIYSNMYYELLMYNKYELFKLAYGLYYITYIVMDCIKRLTVIFVYTNIYNEMCEENWPNLKKVFLFCWAILFCKSRTCCYYIFLQLLESPPNDCLAVLAVFVVVRRYPASYTYQYKYRCITDHSFSTE